MTTDATNHWNNVYASRPADRLTWFQRVPDVSLGLIRMSGAALDDTVIDVGCGASTLLPILQAQGFVDLTGLDLSETALTVARAQIDVGAPAVRWIAADVTCWQPDRQFALWHDRAVFHFLITDAARKAYRTTLAAALQPGGHAIIGTFALDGPAKCSGLPVQRYSPATLAREFAEDFDWIASRDATHRTPTGKKQAFRFVLLRRRQANRAASPANGGF